MMTQLNLKINTKKAIADKKVIAFFIVKIKNRKEFF